MTKNIDFNQAFVSLSNSNIKPVYFLVGSDQFLQDYFINELEITLGIEAKKNYLGMQDGDIQKTHSDIELLKALTGFQPKITMREGIANFVKWYKSYY